MSLNGGVAFLEIAGLDADGSVPTRFADECRAALASAEALLAARGFSLHDVQHLSCAVRDPDAFAQVQALLGEALGPARPAFTLRIVHQLALEEQRIALGVAVSL